MAATFFFQAARRTNRFAVIPVTSTLAGQIYVVTATYLSTRRTNRIAAILPGYDIAVRRTHRITVICPGAGHIVTALFSAVTCKLCSLRANARLPALLYTFRGALASLSIALAFSRLIRPTVLRNTYGALCTNV